MSSDPSNGGDRKRPQGTEKAARAAQAEDSADEHPLKVEHIGMLWGCLPVASSTRAQIVSHGNSFFLYANGSCFLCWIWVGSIF